MDRRYNEILTIILYGSNSDCDITKCSEQISRISHRQGYSISLESKKCIEMTKLHNLNLKNNN